MFQGQDPSPESFLALKCLKLGKFLLLRVPTGPGKLWNFGGPFSRLGKSWKAAKVMESPGK